MNTFELTPSRVGRFEPLKSGCRSLPNVRRELLRAVWEDVAPELSRLIRAMGIVSHRCDDVLQDVYLTAWRKQPDALSRADLRRWLMKVTANRCHLEHRRHARWHKALSTFGRLMGRSQRNVHQSNGRAAGDLEQQELVRRALDRLDPSLRSVLVLRYFAELDSKEIGRTLDLSDSTVRSRLRVARAELASQLKRAGYSHD
ncbi:MAG: RNA polymerase sigma factor [Thermoguttaceae bacterium]